MPDTRSCHVWQLGPRHHDQYHHGTVQLQARRLELVSRFANDSQALYSPPTPPRKSASRAPPPVRWPPRAAPRKPWRLPHRAPQPAQTASAPGATRGKDTAGSRSTARASPARARRPGCARRAGPARGSRAPATSRLAA
eukprot:339156-Prymnesium_polylepis.1